MNNSCMIRPTSVVRVQPDELHHPWVALCTFKIPNKLIRGDNAHKNHLQEYRYMHATLIRCIFDLVKSTSSLRLIALQKGRGKKWTGCPRSDWINAVRVEVTAPGLPFLNWAHRLPRANNTNRVGNSMK